MIELILKLLSLFAEFFMVGLFTFGGGYGAIPLIRDTILSNPDWGVDLEMFQYIVGVAESTPGPIMVNTATYIGTTYAGILGGIFATLGAITPSFLIIVLIAKCLQGFMEKKGTRTVLDTVKPCVVGIILSTGVYFLLSGVIPAINSLFTDGFTKDLVPEWKTVLVFALVFLLRAGWKLWKKKTISPILSIGISAIFGILVFGV